uniref:Uncharacterized protein n=1 Tax=Arundo donax TaxID=35708 RepID=A0A0A9GG80_ARUDO
MWMVLSMNSLTAVPTKTSTQLLIAFRHLPVATTLTHIVGEEASPGGDGTE